MTYSTSQTNKSRSAIRNALRALASRAASSDPKEPSEEKKETRGAMLEALQRPQALQQPGSSRSSRKESSRQNDEEDPFDLIDRFVSTQSSMFITALIEIRQGQKRSCWLWFVLPTAPYIVKGTERGSSMNRHYCLRSDDAVRAYLQFKPSQHQREYEVIDLRLNYIAILKAIQQQLHGGNTMSQLFGPMDSVKAVSSVRLFQRIANDMDDEELFQVCGKVLHLVESNNTNK